MPDFAVVRAQETLGRLEQSLRRCDVKREQPRKRQIDRDDLIDRDRVMGRLQLAQVIDRERELRVGAQLRPFVTGEPPERGLEGVVDDFAIHGNLLALGVRRQAFRDAFSSCPLRRVRPSSSLRTEAKVTPRACSTTSR
jgi:hypothetical protein